MDFAFKTFVQSESDHSKLTLFIIHHLRAPLGTPLLSQTFLDASQFPKNVDILLTSNLAVALRGTLNRSNVLAGELVASPLVSHLVKYIQTNSVPLAINTVSQVFIDNGIPKFVITPSRPLVASIAPVHVQLLGLDLKYAWRVKNLSNSEPSSSNNPFSSRLSLPFRTMLDQVVQQLVSKELVRRYPLIFGPWCQQLDVENVYFPAIFNSVSRMMQRSPNEDFKEKCCQLLETAKTCHRQNHSEQLASLEKYLGLVPSRPSTTGGLQAPLSDEDVLCLSMMNLYKRGARRSPFKGLEDTQTVDRTDDEELSQSFASSVPPLISGALWEEPPPSHSGSSSQSDLERPFDLTSVNPFPMLPISQIRENPFEDSWWRVKEVSIDSQHLPTSDGSESALSRRLQTWQVEDDLHWVDVPAITTSASRPRVNRPLSPQMKPGTMASDDGLVLFPEAEQPADWPNSHAKAESRHGHGIASESWTTDRPADIGLSSTSLLDSIVDQSDASSGGVNLGQACHWRTCAGRANAALGVQEENFCGHSDDILGFDDDPPLRVKVDEDDGDLVFDSDPDWENDLFLDEEESDSGGIADSGDLVPDEVSMFGTGSHIPYTLVATCLEETGDWDLAGQLQEECEDADLMIETEGSDEGEALDDGPGWAGPLGEHGFLLDLEMDEVGFSMEF